jgi:hypothetical protein
MTAVAWVFGLFGALAMLLALSRLAARRRLGAAWYAALAAALVAAAVGLGLPGGRMQVFELVGDTWRIDARTLDFRGWAGAIGGRPGYRLDRLVAFERTPGGGAAKAEPSPTAGFALGARDGIDLWQASRSGGRWRELVTAGDARTEELPMTGKSRFALTLARDRIEVQPTGGDAVEDMVADESTAAAR